MGELKNSMGFKNNDITYVTSKKSVTLKNRMTRNGYISTKKLISETISTNPDGSSASKLKLKNKNGRIVSAFKQVNLTPLGGEVLKNRNERSSVRNISRKAAERKIKRIQRKQQRMTNG